jgi:hypothetical protein
MRDMLAAPNKRLIILDANGNPSLGHLTLENASLTSQAVGPPHSALEMLCGDRTFADIARKVLTPARRPLQSQVIQSTDSTLGPHVHPTGKGLRLQHNYKALVQRAFDEKFWAATKKFRIINGILVDDPGGYTQTDGAKLLYVLRNRHHAL